MKGSRVQASVLPDLFDSLLISFRTFGDGGAVKHSTFTHKSRVIYSDDEDQPEMEYVSDLY